MTLACADTQATDSAHHYAELDQPSLLQVCIPEVIAGRVPAMHIHRPSRKAIMEILDQKCYPTPTCQSISPNVSGGFPRYLGLIRVHSCRER